MNVISADIFSGSTAYLTVSWKKFAGSPCGEPVRLYNPYSDSSNFADCSRY
ncbi:hypothetical protein L373_01998 [Klebsiella michiganensis]|uniref:Uncharacterized protein n=1 Tax=Klebsiella michiganensis TaxID=1134687 RepID=A0A7H5AA12_9ENTR|nr:hypothetical protein HMPREF9686_02869 [Klebsiella michiganensis]EWF89503.1 hypothetical protein L373_01998 [Klebsiella michiganensis]SBL14903.1 Uncharacterised protein [Klebsiella michiganensis]VUS59877.1 hypothetical protein SB6420_02329 [Klebsiella pasteurii]